MSIIYKWQKDINIAGSPCEEQEIGKTFHLRVTLKSAIF